MNLQRVTERGGEYMVLAKLSEFSNQYLCVELSFSTQKINTGENIYALTYKNIEQFKSNRPFFLIDETNLVNNIKNNGTLDPFAVKLLNGDLVNYNGNKYIVLGIVVNTYAQWNLPTPLLLHPNNIVNDYKALFNSRMSDIEINNKINDNFQAGKYDSDMIIPLVDGNDFKETIEVLEARPSDDLVKIQISKFTDEKNAKFSQVKDIFIDTVMRNRSTEIDKLRSIKPELYNSMKEMLTSVNDAINSKISGTSTTTAKKKKEAVAEQVAEDDLSFLDDIDSVLDTSFLDDLDNII
jgi:hypothetical protein